MTGLQSGLVTRKGNLMQLDTTTYIQELEARLAAATLDSARKASMVKQGITTIEQLTGENRELKERLDEYLMDGKDEDADTEAQQG